MIHQGSKIDRKAWEANKDIDGAGVCRKMGLKMEKMGPCSGTKRRRRRPRRRKVARRSEPSYTAPVPELWLSGMESCPTQGGPSLLYIYPLVN